MFSGLPSWHAAGVAVLFIFQAPATMVPIRLYRLFLHALLPAVLTVAPCAMAAVFDNLLNPGSPEGSGSVSGGGMCTPSLTAPPCAQGDAAGLSIEEPSLNLGIGNPVHLATGAKHQFEVDLPASLAHPGLEIVRHYNSMRVGDAPLGTGWRFSYDTRVVVEQGVAQIEQANGAHVIFDRESKSARNGILRRLPDRQGWQWQWPDGRLLDFDADGYLVRIDSPADGFVTEIVRYRDALAPAIAHVHSKQASLHFFYRVVRGTPQLTAIDTPAGRFTYQVQIASSFATRLATVTRPDGMQRLYLYEAQYQSGNSHLPTGVVLVQPADSSPYQENPGSDGGTQRRRISAWDYDAAGRAVGVSYGERTPADGYSRIRYRRIATAARDGITQVDGPAGRTRFTIGLRAGTPRLLKVEGAGCPGCAAPGTQASYDNAGRLLSIHGTRIERDASGQAVAIAPQAPGWPGLRLTFSTTGARRQWQSTLTGLETVQDHVSTRTAVRQFANGDRMDVTYDAQGRPLRIRESRGSAASIRSSGSVDSARARQAQAASPPATPDTITTTLHWRNGQLHCLQHPDATEVQSYDAKGRLHGRIELRRLSPSPTSGNDAGIACEAATTPQTDKSVWRFTEGFLYDGQGRLSAHRLPEGGVIHYVWGQGERLHAMDWEDTAGTRHPVITQVANTAGYRYGNGLHLYAAHDSRQQMSLTLLDATGMRWRQTRVQNAQGHVLREVFHIRPDSPATLADAPTTPSRQAPAWYTLQDWQYAYDAQNRMIGAQSAAGLTHWFAWQADGALAARTLSSANINAATRQPVIARDASGLPGTLGDLTLTYGANRRLAIVEQQGKTLARYVHDAYGQRIRSHSGDVTTDYLYLGHRRVAQTHPFPAGEKPMIARRYLYAHHVPVGMIVYAPDTGRGELYAIHADLLGAPRMVTDAQATVRWLANDTPLGETNRIAGDLTLDLRLPGQWHDGATGLHDNLLRTYAPQWGQYLEPDPLGPVPGNQALGYAAQQPRRFVDPMGLLLFAFDGTRHSERTDSNVMKFLRQYRNGPVYYHGGPGNPYTLTWDAITAFSAPQIVETQWLNLLLALQQSHNAPWMRDADSGIGAIPIDVVGFSRGAALARHFGNLIVQHTSNGLFSYQHDTLGLISACVNLRFMGLLETVAQFGIAGSKNPDYDFGVAEVWRWVSHAVALHERRALFPLTSVRGSEKAHIVELPFIGAHGDIGGGNLLDPEDTPRQGDLADVALNWLWWQAAMAGVSLEPLAEEDRIVREPLMHDMRSATMRLSASDRMLLDTTSSIGLAQRWDDALGAPVRDAVEPLIHRRNGWLVKGDLVVGQVNMRGYTEWLLDALHWNADLGAPAMEHPH